MIMLWYSGNPEHNQSLISLISPHNYNVLG